jgi:hypothetical protein
MSGRLFLSTVARTIATDVSISPRFPVVPTPGAGIGNGVKVGSELLEVDDRSVLERSE